MPELPEVEAARLMIEGALVGKRLAVVIVRPDAIVFGDVAPEALVSVLAGQRVQGTGRRGKFLWLALEDGCLFLHFGMSGAVIELTGGENNAVNYYRRKRRRAAEPGEDPPYTKLRLRADDGAEIAFVDGRRLGRIWLGTSPESDRRVSRLGPDALSELPSASRLHKMMQRRKTPIKALLLDQSFLAGIGNYLADEILLESRIAPARLAKDLSEAEAKRLRKAIQKVVRLAVDVEADYEKFPEDWLFHVRWGGSRGAETWRGHAIVRETIGGRTTAWVPDVQK